MDVIWALWRLQIFTVWLWPCVLVYNALKLLWMIKDGKKDGYRMSALLCAVSIFMLTSFPVLTVIIGK